MVSLVWNPRNKNFTTEVFKGQQKHDMEHGNFTSEVKMNCKISCAVTILTRQPSPKNNIVASSFTTLKPNMCVVQHFTMIVCLRRLYHHICLAYCCGYRACCCFCQWYSWWRHQMETFPRYRPFVRGIHRSSVNCPYKGQWRGALIFLLIYAWINGCANNREASDLRRHRDHYDATVMCTAYNVCYRQDT